ncbi:hypothetical protein HanPI659440_Chr15g0576681 [Helianthus annuus]|nr:hypothetical protein HanPI659440_Chr15g0576681 [Helianthus annuus]
MKDPTVHVILNGKGYLGGLLPILIPSHLHNQPPPNPSITPLLCPAPHVLCPASSAPHTIYISLDETPPDDHRMTTRRTEAFVPTTGRTPERMPPSPNPQSFHATCNPELTAALRATSSLLLHQIPSL